MQAQEGDCLFLQYGKSGTRFMMIDSGPSYSQALKTKLKEIASLGEIDVAVITHIDNDHIVGMVGLLRDLKDGIKIVKINSLWLNTLSDVTGIPPATILSEIQSIPKSTFSGSSIGQDMVFAVPQAEEVKEKAGGLDLELNPHFSEGKVTLESAQKPITLENISIQIIGPSLQNYQELRKAWDKIKKEKLGLLLAKRPSKDNSPWNLSSIMFLVTSSTGKRILFTGDGIGDDIISGLRKAKLLKNGKIHVDIFKVPHHGSNRNNDEKLFSTVIADTYVMSANDRHGNPDIDVLEMIAHQAKKDKRHFKLLLTNETKRVKQEFLDKYDKAEYDYELDSIPDGRPSIEIDADS